MRKSAHLLSVVLFLLSLSVITFSCTKTGETGETGATGAAGTANVMYSGWTNLKMTYNTTDSAYEQSVKADSLTQAVLDSGLVLTYIKYTNSAGTTQVESASTYVGVVFSLKSIVLYAYYYDFTGVPFRYIIIHGGTAIGSRLSGPPDLFQGHTGEEWKSMSYEQVVSILGISK